MSVPKSSYIILAEIELKGRGSAVINAKEKSTGRAIGSDFLYLSMLDTGENVNVYILFDGDEFPNVRQAEDVVMDITYLAGNQTEPFPGRIVSIRKNDN